MLLLRVCVHACACAGGDFVEFLYMLASYEDLQHGTKLTQRLVDTFLFQWVDTAAGREDPSDPATRVSFYLHTDLDAVRRIEMALGDKWDHGQYLLDLTRPMKHLQKDILEQLMKPENHGIVLTSCAMPASGTA
jgi:hypothetical protein